MKAVSAQIHMLMSHEDLYVGVCMCQRGRERERERERERFSLMSSENAQMKGLRTESICCFS